MDKKPVSICKNKLVDARIIPLFPTPLIIGNVPDIKICDRLESKLRKEMKAKRGQTEAGVFTTDDQLHVKGRGFEELTTLVMGEVKQYMDWLHLSRTGHKITGMWGNITTKHHRHPMHIHPNSYVSGVIYIKTPNGCGNIAFSDPRPGARVIEPDYTMMNEFNSGIHSHTPVKGTMLLWPSWMPHGVEQGVLEDDNEERIVIAFNVQMIGNVERRTSKMRFSR